MNVSQNCCKEKGCWHTLPIRFLKKVSILTAICFCFYADALAFSPGDMNPPAGGAEEAAAVITGKVVDESGKGLGNVSVTVSGTDRGITTSADGAFSIDAKPGDVLVFSMIGYKSVSVTVGDDSTLQISMAQEATALSDVVVVGYGTQKKVNLTGAVDQVTSKVLESRPVSNIGQALQGLMPNLNITIANGRPNTSPAINIRGGTSFGLVNGTYQTFTGSPLILVDGIEMDINQLNPEDIASISILKDAASAAIYGARAAFGVMLVTTKKGRKGEKTKINYSNSFQWNSPAAIPDLLDAYTIEEAAIKALEMQNQTPSSDLLDKLQKVKAHMDNPTQVLPYFMDAGNNIVWIGNTRVYDEAVQKNSPMQKHNLSLAGGGEKSSYFASFGYQAQDGLYKLNTDKSKRYNALVKVSSEVTNWFGVEFRSNFSKSNYTEPVSPTGKGGWWTAMAQESGRNINMPIKTPASSPVGVMYTDNILSFMDYGSLNDESDETLVLSASPYITPLKNWSVKADISYKSYNFNRKQIVPELRRVESRWDTYTTVYTNPTYIQKWKEHSDQYTINAYTDYSLNIKKHSIYALAGYNQEWYVYNYLGGRGEQILSPNIPVIGQTLGNEFAYDAESHWAIRGGFYRLTYNFGNKYLLESNGRYDGTSRFPRDSRFKFFNSYSGAWRVTEENFARPFKHIVNELKLRASYGSLGNQNVANYIYIPSYGTVDQVQHLFNGTRPVGITPPGLVSPFLTWENAATIDFGIDLTLLRRLDLSFDWYRRKTTDILVAGDKFPAVLGATPPTKNSGAMETLGWEFTAKWKDRLKNGLSYDIAFNLSDYQSSITSFDGNPNNLLSTLYTGMKMGEIWGYETVGIFQNQAQIDGAPKQNKINSGVWYPGDIQYADLNKDGEVSSGANTLENPGDRKIIGNSTPRFQFGLNMNAAYKGFDLNIFFQGVGKRDFWTGHRFYWGAIAGGTGTWEVYNDSWRPDRTDAFYPAYKNKSANIQSQTRYLINGAYIRLKNLSLGYSLPRNILQKIHVDRIRFYAATYNIWQSSNVPDVFDPEMMSADYPMIKSVSFGMQVTF